MLKVVNFEKRPHQEMEGSFFYVFLLFFLMFFKGGGLLIAFRQGTSVYGVVRFFSSWEKLGEVNCCYWFGRTSTFVYVTMCFMFQNVILACLTEIWFVSQKFDKSVVTWNTNHKYVKDATLLLRLEVIVQ